MTGRRGALQRGRSDVIRPEKIVRPGLPLSPGDPERPMYEDLLTDMEISGAEILREGIRVLYRQRFGDRPPVGRKAAQKQLEKAKAIEETKSKAEAG
jgi:hypothetical protein